jgi:hypothetical protein
MVMITVRVLAILTPAHTHSPSIICPFKIDISELQVDLLDSMLEGDPYDVEQLTDVNSLRHQLETTEQPFASRFRGLSTGLCEVLDSYGLLNFSPLSIQDASSVRELVDIIDGANGYKHSGLQGQNPYPVALDEDS